MSFYQRYPKRKKKNPAKELLKLQKERPNARPVVVSRQKLAKTWWGQTWNKNLERYSDYSNRLPRGRSYVRAGNILDLQIGVGQVEAVVLGGDVYQVNIAIKPLSAAQWKHVVKVCGNRIAGLEQLCEGEFPAEFNELFSAQGSGLFPVPKDIQFDCSCPDWAGMCKHVAAVLYGIGVRFDEDPTLFFKLRDIPFEQLLKKSIERKSKEMLMNAEKVTSRVLSEEDATALFGKIE